MSNSHDLAIPSYVSVLVVTHTDPEGAFMAAKYPGRKVGYALVYPIADVNGRTFSETVLNPNEDRQWLREYVQKRNPLVWWPPAIDQDNNPMLFDNQYDAVQYRDAHLPEWNETIKRMRDL